MQNLNDERAVALTAGLKGLLDQRMDNAKTPEEAISVLMNIEQGIEHYKKEFSKIPVGYNRAYNVNRMIDQSMLNEKTKYPKEWAQISCKAGCSHCCHNTVVITECEADLLVTWMGEQKIEIDQELLKRQAAFTGSDSEWFRLPKTENRCVFLDDQNKCKVYEHRPASCRKYVVTTPAEACDDRIGSQQVASIIDVNTEVMYSGMMDIDHSKVGPLPVKLFKRINEGILNENANSKN